jgi:hypothetical protein
MRRSMKLCYALPALWLWTALGVTAAGWTVDMVDPTGGGTFTSLRFDKTGNAHVAYYDEPEHLLRYGFWDHRLRQWFTTNIDQSAGFCSLTLDSRQLPHISYMGWGTGQVKYAHWDGSSWKKETIEMRGKNIGFYSSIAVDLNDNPIISFYEYSTASEGNEPLLRLRTVNWNGSYWTVRTVDGTPGSGKFNSIAADSLGRPHVAYANVKYEHATLRYASWDGHAWNPQIIEGVERTGYAAFSVSLALDHRDRPHIAYTDVNKRLVKYITKSGDTWKSEVVDSLERLGYPDRNGIALDPNGNPYISYYDEGSGQLKVAHKNDGAWVTEVVDTGFVGFTSSLQICNGEIWVTYTDGSGLRAAHRALESLPSSVPDLSKVTPGDQRGDQPLLIHPELPHEQN